MACQLAEKTISRNESKMRRWLYDGSPTNGTRMSEYGHEPIFSTATKERQQKSQTIRASRGILKRCARFFSWGFDYASLRLDSGCDRVSVSHWRGCCSGRNFRRDGDVQLRWRQATRRRISARCDKPEQAAPGPRNSLWQSLGARREAHDAVYQHADRGRRETACGRCLYDVRDSRSKTVDADHL